MAGICQYMEMTFDDMEKHPKDSRNIWEMDCESYLWSQYFDLNLEGWVSI
jgi:hypothetical protein